MITSGGFFFAIKTSYFHQK